MIARDRHRRTAAGLLAIVVPVVLSACSVQGDPVVPETGQASGSVSATGGAASVEPVAGVPAVYTDLQPLTDAPKMTGKMVLNPKVKRLPSSGAVTGISSDARHFYFTAAGAKGLTAGDFFILPGIAARHVVAVAAPSNGSVDVTTDQASLDDLFSDLDVTFHATDGQNSRPGGDPIRSADTSPIVSYQTSSAQDAPPAPTIATTSTSTSKLRGPGAALAASGCRSLDTSVAITVKGVTYTPSFARTPDCKGFTFGLDIGGDANEKGTVSLALSLKGAITISSISGHLTAGLTGSSSSTSFGIDASAGLSGKAQAQDKGGAVYAIRLTWDVLKDDFNFLLGEIPMVFRAGVPLIIEPRFSGGGDMVSGDFLSFKCKGTLTLATGSVPNLDICSLQPANVSLFSSIAPSAVVFAAGLKTGVGPGVAINGKAEIFAGIYSVLTAAVGISTSGAAASMLERCWRIDRSVGFNFGAEALVDSKSVSAQVTLAEKKATNYVGDACPKSMTG